MKIKSVKSGGGIRMNKNVSRPMPKNSAKAMAINPAALTRGMGQAIGNHSERGSANVPHVPLFRAPISSVPLGNSVATNIGKGAPGAGRKVFPSGGQGSH